MDSLATTSKFISFTGKIHLIKSDQDVKHVAADLENSRIFGFDTDLQAF